jgi:hypothetical protein
MESHKVDLSERSKMRSLGSCKFHWAVFLWRSLPVAFSSRGNRKLRQYRGTPAAAFKMVRYTSRQPARRVSGDQSIHNHQGRDC